MELSCEGNSLGRRVFAFFFLRARLLFRLAWSFWFRFSFFWWTFFGWTFWSSTTFLSWWRWITLFRLRLAFLWERKIDKKKKSWQENIYLIWFFCCRWTSSSLLFRNNFFGIRHSSAFSWKVLSLLLVYFKRNKRREVFKTQEDFHFHINYSSNDFRANATIFHLEINFFTQNSPKISNLILQNSFDSKIDFYWRKDCFLAHLSPFTKSERENYVLQQLRQGNGRRVQWRKIQRKSRFFLWRNKIFRPQKIAKRSSYRL